MDVIKVEPDSDSDCHQMCSQSDGYFDGLKQDRRALPEVTSKAKVGDIFVLMFPKFTVYLFIEKHHHST